MNARVYAFYGVLFGVSFPFFGTLLQALFLDAAVGGFFTRLGHAQSMPIMWIVDTAPIVFGLLGHMVGKREDEFCSREDSKREQLKTTAGELFAGAENLLSTVSSFSAMATQTATSVRETTNTMQQLSQTAGRAALSAETVVGIANATKKSSEDGLQEIKFSVAELVKLSEDVRGLAKSVEGINERMRNIFEIASVMNYLGDRFQSLADSAASEMGQGDAQGLPMGLRFIVAEMRRQGKDAKNGATLVQNMVNEMQKVMTNTMSAAENGVRRAERGAQIANRTGDNIKRMSSALLNSSQAAMEIANIAKQQDSGIDEVLKSMNQVYLATEEAMSSTQRVAEEAKGLKDLAGRIDSSVRVNGAMTAAPALKMPRALLKLTGGHQ
jgi:methyl-accepting chemotaxis protein